MRVLDGHGDFGDLPSHWIGVRKGWLDSCSTFDEALVSVPPSAQKKHVYVAGSTGTGKSSASHHFMARDVLLGHSFIVIDMRGDLVAAALEICAGRVPPERIKVFDLREKERPLGFNPLYGSGEPYFRALSVLDAIEQSSESWGVQLSESMRNALLLLAENGASITKLETLFADAKFRRDLLKRCTSESVKTFWQRYDVLSSEKQATLTSPVLNKVSLLFSTESLRRMLGHQASLDLGKHLNTPGSVTLISLAVDELHGAARMMGSLFLSAICREVFARVEIPEGKRIPIRLYVDEFENFGMSDYESILAEGRRFGLSLFLAHQTLAQLPTKTRSIILNNVGVKLVFRTGREDAATLSKDLGLDPKNSDIASLPTGDAVLWQQGEKPIHIEVNAPLFEGMSLPTDGVKELRRQLRDLTPQYITEFYEPEPPEPKSKPDEGKGGSLEDWL